MRYAIIPIAELTRNQLKRSGVSSANNVRRNADGTLGVIKFHPDQAQNFAHLQTYSEDEIRVEMNKASWTGESWYESLLNFFGV